MNTFANEIFPRTVLYVEFLSLQKYNFYLIKKNMKLKETKILLSEIWLCIIIDKIKYYIYLKNNDMRVFIFRAKFETKNRITNLSLIRIAEA